MQTMFTLVVIVQVLAALTIIGLVLLQHGKGADMGASFGSGASGSLFGATGSSNFLSKSTGVAAAVFFAATLALAYMGANRNTAPSAGVMDNLPAVKAVTAAGASAAAASAPAAPAVAAPSSAAGQANQIPK
ncbi:preprotein translocase subunit SecG [Undibacterium sp. TJN25]|uniref:preprotein translocase subunit SecG n=2 Tax=unclassified Undibacterium TaxID=2630295 RepID=UPI003BF19A0A